jgi:omega-hydroxy-beta-dihydromenaquinone-9 sulfotransferase
LNDSYLTAGIKLGKLFRLLGRNKISVTTKNLLRLIFLVQAACWSSLFSLIEKARYSKILETAPVPDDPIFIIGHWRTGSTFLHQLMSLDPQFCAPTLFQVAVPDSFLVSYSWYKPVFKRVLSKHRPMDHVKMGMDEPQEDEYAIYRITDHSPLEHLVFPKSGCFFLNQEMPLMPSGTELEKWKSDLLTFYRKLHFQSKKRIVSKNPFNSFRIKVLCEMFPNAKFIHIVRHPYAVVPSSVNMWNIVQQQNCLGNPVTKPGYNEITDALDNLLTVIETDSLQLAAGQYAEIRYEDLEKNPAEALKKVYHLFNISFTAEYEAKIGMFLWKTLDFQKNEYTLPDESKSYIRERMAHRMNKYSYQ